MKRKVLILLALLLSLGSTYAQQLTLSDIIEFRMNKSLVVQSRLSEMNWRFVNKEISEEPKELSYFTYKYQEDGELWEKGMISYMFDKKNEDMNRCRIIYSVTDNSIYQSMISQLNNSAFNLIESFSDEQGNNVVYMDKYKFTVIQITTSVNSIDKSIMMYNFWVFGKDDYVNNFRLKK